MSGLPSLGGGRSIPVLPGELAVADCEARVDLVSHALGSCVGVVLFDPRAGVGGMLHALLPDQRSGAGSKRPPVAFADAGVPILFDELIALGARRSRMKVALAGGASRPGAPDHFRIARRNVLSARRALLDLGLLVDAETVGGEMARTLRLEVATGRVTVTVRGVAQVLLAPTR